MSLFFPRTLKCPKCGEEVEFQVNASLNADRRPDLREQILNESFQKGNCGKCGAAFRMDPQMIYLDVGRGQWMAAFPSGKYEDWTTVEAETRQAFAKAYGKKAAPDAQEIGEELKPRLVFGWAGLREKLIAEEQKLDDVELELLKISFLRGIDNPPIEPGTELRLVGVDAEESELVLAAFEATTGELNEELRVPRDLYDEIAADKKGWQELRGELADGLFVDYRRLLNPGGAENPTDVESKKSKAVSASARAKSSKPAKKKSKR